MDGQVDFRDMRKTLDQAFANSKRGASKRKRLFHLDMQERVKRGVNDVFEQIEMDIDDKLDEEVYFVSSNSYTLHVRNCKTKVKCIPLNE